jgi:hypothetical protein
MKSLNCNELISLLKSHNILSQWITPHFFTNETKIKKNVYSNCGKQQNVVNTRRMKIKFRKVEPCL